MKDKPNILMIFTDQQRWDTLAAYGNTTIHTPNLDRLAQQGAVFETAITPCPLCMPARACVMTGLTASRLGSLENVYPKHVDPTETIAGVLKGQGYHCQAIGKMHFSDTPYAETYGMDEMILSEETRGVRLATDEAGIVLDDYDRFLSSKSFWGWDKPTEIGYNEIKPLLNPLPKASHVTQWCGDQSVTWLKNGRPKDKPFFLWTSFVKPHVPYDCSQHLVDLYDPSTLEKPWLSSEDGTERNPYFASYRKGKEFDLYSEVAAERAKAYYYANITFIDEQVGRILDALDEEGLSESTMVIFTSDHGDLLGDHGLWYKCFGFEGSLRVPLLMRWPNHIQPQTRCSEIASLLDLFPTLLSSAGVDYAQYNRPGNDLISLISKEEEQDFAISEVMFPPYTMNHIRTKRYKYLFYQNGGYEQLFDLQEDPHELKDISTNPESQSIRNSLKGRLENWIRIHGDGSYALDDEGKLKTRPYQEHQESKDYPFSRMPWDSRVPPVLTEKKKTLFFKNDSQDWLSQLNKNHR